MKISAASLLVGFGLMALSGAAQADSNILSATQQDFVVSYTLPSGAEAKDTLYKGTDTLGYLGVPAKPGKPLNVIVSDPDGTVLAKGVVQDNHSYLVMPSGKGFTLVDAGLLSQTASSPYSGVGFVSTLPEEYTIDLAGDSGQSGVKGVKATSFSIKTSTKLPTTDNRYRATIHLPDGTTVKGLSAVDAGSYYVIHKNYEGKITASSAGYIELPSTVTEPTKEKPKKGKKP
jgi:hypothetical protein